MRDKKRAILFIIFSSLFSGTGQLLWKQATINTTHYIDIFITYWVYLGILFYLIATFLMILAFKYGELSVLFPLLSTTYLWTILLSIILFDDETINFSRILGVLIIILGACALGIQQKKNSSNQKIPS